MNVSESELERYVAVVDAGSVAAAARTLGMPRETLSRQLARLEQRLSVRLLHRTTRRLTPTDAGQELYRRAVPIVAAIDEAMAAVRQHDGVPRGVLRLTIPGGVGVLLAEVLAEYQDRCPHVTVEVLSTGRYVDLVAEGYDVALRAGVLADSSLVARVLSRSRLLAFASPAYLDARGRPGSAHELAEHDCICGFSSDERPQTSWALLDGGQVKVRPRLVANDLALLRALILAGKGIACIPEGMVLDDLATGRLESVLSDVVGVDATIYLVYPERAWLPPKTRVFVDLCMQRLPGRIPGSV